MKEASKTDRDYLRAAIENADASGFDQVAAIVQKTGAIQATEARARRLAQEAQACLHDLPDSAWKTHLIELAAFAAERHQ